MSSWLTGLKFGVAALAAGALVGGLVSAPANADVVDPQLFVQQSGSSPAGGEPNLITNTGSLVVGVAGNHTMNNPLLIIVGVYNGTSSTSAPSISFTGGVTKAAVGTYGLNAQQATFTSGDAFATLGLSAGGSESFGNWACGKNGCPGTGGDIGLGLAAPTSFELYAFALNVALDPSNSPITIGVSGAAKGSYIIAYGCEGTSGTSACSGGNIGQTVYTDTALLDSPPSVPEPSSLAAMGSGFAFLGLVLAWRRRRQA